MRFIIIAFCALLSVVGNAQSTHWTVFINHKKLFSASLDSVQTMQLPKSEKGNLFFTFPDKNQQFNRSLLFMNHQRNTLLKKELKTTCLSASVAIDTLLLKTGGNPFVIYMLDVPANPQKAMAVRVAPVAVCYVQWTE